MIVECLYPPLGGGAETSAWTATSHGGHGPSSWLHLYYPRVVAVESSVAMHGSRISFPNGVLRSCGLRTVVVVVVVVVVVALFFLSYLQQLVVVVLFSYNVATAPTWSCCDRRDRFAPAHRTEPCAGENTGASPHAIGVVDTQWCCCCCCAYFYFYLLLLLLLLVGRAAVLRASVPELHNNPRGGPTRKVSLVVGPVAGQCWDFPLCRRCCCSMTHHHWQCCCSCCCCFCCCCCPVESAVSWLHIDDDDDDASKALRFIISSISERRRSFRFMYVVWAVTEHRPTRLTRSRVHPV